MPPSSGPSPRSAPAAPACGAPPPLTPRRRRAQTRPTGPPAQPRAGSGRYSTAYGSVEIHDLGTPHSAADSDEISGMGDDWHGLDDQPASFGSAAFGSYGGALSTSVGGSGGGGGMHAGADGGGGPAQLSPTQLESLRRGGPVAPMGSSGDFPAGQFEMDC
eukprot:SAG11_NODE_2976_length_2796_cov_5.021505_1_plen_161_part_00